MSDERELHWLVRPATIKKLWVGFSGLLALLVAAGAFVHWHPHFAVEEVFGFHAWYGLLSCAAMVLLAKALGVLLKRGEGYYDD